MIKKIIVLLIVIVFFIPIQVLAVEQISIEASKNIVEQGETFQVIIDTNDVEIAAFTVWIYFETDKLECIENVENANVVDGKMIYSYFSETGKNEKFKSPFEIDFKAKTIGKTTMSVIAEFYNENGEKIDTRNVELYIDIEEPETENKNKDNASNANLDVLRVNVEGITPQFEPEVYEYYLVTEENIKDLDVMAIPENESATVKISGNTKLEQGINKIEIEVTSQDKTKTQKYVINLTETKNEENANAKLGTLAIEGFTLTPEYSENKNNYMVEVDNNTEKLNLLAISEDINANVKVSGNDNLQTGHNEIEIEVTAKDGITKQKYVVDVYKRSEAEQEKYEQEEQQKEQIANEVLEQHKENIVENEAENSQNGEMESNIEEQKNNESTNQNVTANSLNELEDTENSIGEIEENQNTSKEEKNDIVNKVFMWVGSIVALIVAGIVGITMYRKKKEVK